MWTSARCLGLLAITGLDGLFLGAGNVPWWARFFHGSFSELQQGIRM
jgi:hypothetical protein